MHDSQKIKETNVVPKPKIATFDIVNSYGNNEKKIEEALKQILPVEKKSILADKFVELINKK